MAGAACGVAAERFAPGSPTVAWIADNVAGPVGQVFLRLLLLTVVPLVFASVALGVVGIGDVGKLGRVGARTLGAFLLSTALSGVVGLVIVNALEPGGDVPIELRERLLEQYRSNVETLRPAEGRDLAGDLFGRIIPSNPIEAAVTTNFLGVLFFALVFGAALAKIPEEKGRPMVRVLEALAAAIGKIIDLAMRLAPIGVFGLVFVATSRFGWALLERLGLYVVAVLGGLLFHAVVGLSTIVRVFAGLDPRVFWRRVRPSILTAFSTSSSNATLPTNLAVAERALGIPPRIAGFVLPLGATMNMNGTSLYEGVTVLFLAQVFGVDLTIGQQAIVLALAVVTAVGAAGVPGGSLPLLMVVLGTVGVPPESIADILGVDRILDMSRTILNVTGDLAVAAYVARAEGV